MKKQNKDNATCIICGEKYHLCIACERNKETWKPWKMIADSENCYDIYQVLNDYNFKKISKNEARALLECLDLTNLNSFKDSVKEKINEIMKTKKVKVVKAETIEENKEKLVDSVVNTTVDTEV